MSSKQIINTTNLLSDFDQKQPATNQKTLKPNPPTTIPTATIPIPAVTPDYKARDKNNSDSLTQKPLSLTPKSTRTQTINNFSTDHENDADVDFERSDDDDDLTPKPDLITILNTKVSNQKLTINHHKDQIRKITHKVKKLEAKSEMIFEQSGNTTDFTTEAKLLAIQEELTSKIISLEETVENRTRDLQKAIRMKNEAFLEIGALRNTVEELQEQVTSDQTMNEKFQRINRDNITNLSAKVSDQASTQRRLMAKMEEHYLKLNTTGKYQ